jgi:archaellum component FlaC
VTDINEFLLNKLDKIENKIDSVKDEQLTQAKLLGDYNESLREHMRRTEILEKKVKPLHTQYEEELLAEKLKMKTWKKLVAAVGIIGTLVGLGVGIAQLLGLIK